MSQNGTIPAIKARILAIAAQHEAITTAGGANTGVDGDNLVNGGLAPWSDQQLPAVVVRLAATPGRKRITFKKTQVTRRFNVFLFVARVVADTDAAELEAIQAAEALIDDLPAHFLDRPQLHLAAVSDGIALASTPLVDEGAVIVSYGKKTFSAIKYAFVVDTVEDR